MRVATKDTDTCMFIGTHKTWVFRHADVKNGLLHQFFGVAVSLHVTYRKGYFCASFNTILILNETVHKYRLAVCSLKGLPFGKTPYKRHLNVLL